MVETFLYLRKVYLIGTSQYKQVPDVTFVYPFKTADNDDSDDEFEDDVNDEPPYPSYRFDRFFLWHSNVKDFRSKSVSKRWRSGLLRSSEGLEQRKNIAQNMNSIL